jgi:ATP adenylyltransferase
MAPVGVSLNASQFQLRYCPALQKKPGTSPKGSQGNKNEPKPDPFANPSEDLLVADLDSHILVLNKYPVIENHFILATKISKPQTGLLEPDDLSLTHACLQAWSKDAPSNQPRRLFAFFNSGEHSGASQAHRHIQFIAFEDMTKGGSQGDWQLLTDRMTSKVALSPLLRRDTDLPFLHYATELWSTISAHDLHSRYISLLRAAVCGSTRQSPAGAYDKDERIEWNGEAVISYNLAMTTDTMAILP